MEVNINKVRTEPRIIIASLIPFRHYVRVRYTGKIRIVYYDGKKKIFRSSLLPRPERPIDIRYSRRGLYKKGYPKMKLRKIAKAFLSSLPKDYRTYRLLLSISKLRNGGFKYTVNKMRSEVAKALGIISPKYIGKLIHYYNARGYKIVRRSIINRVVVFFLLLLRLAKAVVRVGERLIILY